MNLMTARNLGVVFGRKLSLDSDDARPTLIMLVDLATLMWSRDPGSEFSDMAGKALMVEWLVENADTIFQP